MLAFGWISNVGKAVELPKMSLPYIAGFFDGEGSVEITRRKRPTVRGGIRFTLRVRVTNADFRPLLAIRRIFGGNIHRRFPAGGTMFAYTLTIQTRQARRFLEAVGPFLIVKKTQGELGLTFQGLKGAERASHRDEAFRVREAAMYAEMRRLKRDLPITVEA